MDTRRPSGPLWIDARRGGTRARSPAGSPSGRPPGDIHRRRVTSAGFRRSRRPPSLPARRPLPLRSSTPTNAEGNPPVAASTTARPRSDTAPFGRSGGPNLNMIEKVTSITLNVVQVVDCHKTLAHRDDSVNRSQASSGPPRGTGRGLLLPTRNFAPGKPGGWTCGSTWGDHRIGPAGSGAARKALKAPDLVVRGLEWQWAILGSNQ